MTMDYSRDELRRELADLEAEHRASINPWRDALARVFGGDNSNRPAATIDRRRLFRVGGLTLATSAVVAACARHGEAEQVPILGAVEAPPTTAARVVNDVTLLRTASSLEAVAVAVYQKAIDELISGADLKAAAGLFRDQHAEHQALFEGATRNAGGEAFGDPNPVVMANVVQPAVEAGFADDAAVITFAAAIEDVAAATYQALVPLLTTPRLRLASMSVGGVEARHAAILRGLLDGAVPVAGFGAIKNAGQSTTTVAGAEPAAEVAQVPSAFGTIAAALGPNSFAY